MTTLAILVVAFMTSTGQEYHRVYGPGSAAACERVLFRLHLHSAPLLHSEADAALPSYQATRAACVPLAVEPGETV